MSKGVYVDRDVIRSAAIRRLSRTALYVFLIFLSKRQVEKVRHAKRSSEWRLVNQGQIEFTYREALARYGIKKNAFTDAIDRLMEVGFLDIAHSGGGMFKDKNLFGLSDRWRNYGKPDFETSSRPKERRRIGFQKGRGETAGVALSIVSGEKTTREGEVA
jgi:hypothetical protein